MKTRTCSQIAAICATVFSSATLAQAADTTLTAFKIDAPTMSQALLQFTEQSRLQLAFASDQPLDLKAPKVEGTLTPRAALDELLKGTGLKYEFVNDRTVSIRKAAEVRAQPDKTSGNSGASRIHLAQAEQEDRSSSGSPGSEGTVPSDSNVQKIEQVTITGSRLLRTRDDGPAQVAVFDREHIDQLGASNVADVLDYLPQQSFSDAEVSNFGSSRSIQMRGLGVGTTLILINGRRAVTSALNGSQNFFDANTIPLSAVERIEVLANSASAVYGADAIGGVVNILLKKDIERPTADLYFGNTWEGSSLEKRASFSIGHSWSRARVSVVLDAFHRDPLMGSERDRFVDADFRRFGAMDRRVTTANPGNISSVSGQNLPGLPSTFAAVPSGSTGVGLTPESFLGTAGQSNLDSPSRFASVIHGAERYSAFASGDWSVNDQTHVFADYLYVSRDDERIRSPASLSNSAVSAANPFNPFGVPVRASFLFERPVSDRFESDFQRAVAGIAGEGRRWNWEISYLHSRDNGTQRRYNTLNTAAAAAALNATDTQRAINVFQDGPGASDALLDEVLVEQPVNAFEARADQLGGYVGVRFGRLPGGDIQAVVGGELREEKIDLANRSLNVFLTPSRRTKSAYTELLLPLAGRDSGIPSVERLAITIAARYDHYDDFGGTLNPQWAIEWALSATSFVRVSYGDSYRAPSLFQLYSPRSALTSAQTLDPRRNETANITQITGGNPNLKAEEANALSAGLMHTFGGPDGMKASATYWRIRQDLRVKQLSVLQVVANEDLFLDRIVRAPQTQNDVASNIPGRLISVDASNLNFGAVDTDGIDVQLQQRVSTSLGELSPSITATYVRKYDAINFPGQPASDRVGVANIEGTVPRWKAVGALAWRHRGWEASGNVRFTGAYDDADIFGARTGREIPSQAQFDLQLAYHVGQTGASVPGLDHLVLRAGVVNLFNKEAPYSDVSFNAGFDPSQADLRQRFGYLSLSKQF